MFRECSRKLSDTVNVDLAYLVPARQPPEAKEVEKLYKDLWGKIGPSDLPISQGCASGGLIREYFPSVIAEGISERINKIRNKTAIGLNIVCYTSHYPENWRENRITLIPKPNKDANKDENWRRITIGPILARIFYSILDRRRRKDIVQNIR
jgi:hypothetical protein